MATETLIPDSGGAETALNYYDGSDHGPDVLHNFEQIDDQDVGGNPDPDDGSTYVYWNGAAHTRDLYNLPASEVGAGTINKITVYFRVNRTIFGDYAKPVIRSNTTVTEGTDRLLEVGWETLSQEWAQNPVGPANWTWDDIDDLQIGVSLKADKAGDRAYCTLVYVVVDYTPPVGTNMKINISDVFKDIDELKINIADAWKNVVKIQQNIGDVWKDVFG